MIKSFFLLLLISYLFAADAYFIEPPQYTFNDGLVTTKFFTEGRQFDNAIEILLIGSIPNSELIYNYSIGCWGENGKNNFREQRYGHLNPVASWVDMNPLSRNFLKEIWQFNAQDSFYVPENKELRFCSINGNELYYVDYNCVKNQSNQEKDLSKCKQTIRSALGSSGDLQVYSESEYTARLQLLQQQEQSDRDLWRSLGIALGAAFITAILTATLPWAFRYYFLGPKLSMEFGNPWECTETGDYGKMFGCAVSGTPDTKIIRLKVVNTGKESATKCYGKITRVYFNGRELDGFIPVHLIWASRQDFRVKLFKSKSQIDLAPGDSDYLNVCACMKAIQEKLMPLAAYPYSPDKFLPIGLYVFQISLFCNNSDAKTIKLEINHTGKWFELSAKETR